ncbi:hypothetical protein CY34DRAFT_34635, partial [Suillus luteus UH-Slu-Lm8-n1]
DNDEGWVDEVSLLPEWERNELQREIQPVKLVLVKLHKLAYKLIHLTTVLLPTWHKVLCASGQAITNIPWDVATQCHAWYAL